MSASPRTTASPSAADVEGLDASARFRFLDCLVLVLSAFERSSFRRAKSAGVSI